MPYNTTFVTCFMNIYDTVIDNRTTEWRISQFREIAETGIYICVYGCEQTMPYLREFVAQYPNVILMDLGMSYKDLLIHKLCYEPDLSLPDCRNATKDTAEYMALMHSKIEFVYNAIKQNPWNTANFAWMDFSMSYMFKRRNGSLAWLKELSQLAFPSTFFAIPGCWDKINNDSVDKILNSIHWRFCGTFFIGDAESINELHNLYMEYYPKFLGEYKKLIWEVNFWAYLEGVCGWSPTWYSSDHNDRIIEITADLFSRRLEPVANIIEYEYPYLDPYIPTSAAYLFYNGRHILNTRFVNYWCYPNGYYLFNDKDGVIRNRNLFCYLQENDNGIFIPSNDGFNEMNIDSVDLPKREERSFSEGLEDIRLYTDMGVLKFVATTVNYSETGRNMMIIGNYDYENMSYSQCQIVKPPTDSWIEKNWIPLNDGRFIYKWSPMEVGHIDNESSRLVIDLQYNIQNSYFHKIRGSTLFVNTPDGLVGVVHFSEDKSPRHYSHMLVLLENETFRPLKMSRIFHFENLSIEFCIGFTIKDDKYFFWISRFDREPALFVVNTSEIEFEYNFIIAE